MAFSMLHIAGKTHLATRSSFIVHVPSVYLILSFYVPDVANDSIIMMLNNLLYRTGK